MLHRSRTVLMPSALSLLLAACAAPPPPSPAPAATPAAQPPPASPQHEVQTVAPAAPPAGQAAPGSMNQESPAPAERPSSLTTGEKKTKGAAFNSVADAEAALARANQQLVALYTPQAKAEARGGAAVSAGKPTAHKAREATAPNRESRCAIACKAFASLKRAADAVCRLAGEDDARCDHAKKLVDENGRRVAQCGCRDGG